MPPSTIPPRSHAYAHLRPNQLLTITSPSGTQVVDTWAFAPLPISFPNPNPPPLNFSFLSTNHTLSSLLKLSLAPSDTLLTNHRQPLLTLVHDTSGGAHSLLFSACDPQRYRQLGVHGPHASCAGNLHAALLQAAASLGAVEGKGDSPGQELRTAIVSAAEAVQGWTPDPVNLFMNVPVEKMEGGRGGAMRLGIPEGRENAEVGFRAEAECVVVMSACPMERGGYNGKEVVWEVRER